MVCSDSGASRLEMPPFPPKKETVLGGSAIQCVGLTKRYSKHTVFADLNLDIPAQGVCAILGRNGAGKTTLIRLALGLARPTAGYVDLLGCTPGAGNRQVGYLSESLAVYPHLSALENMRVAYDSAGLRPPSARMIGDQLARVGLSGAGRRASRRFSLGMKRRLQLAMATLVRPVDLILPDEPTNGLDIDGLAWLRDFVADQAAGGTSVVISTHALSELESLVSHVTILHGGRVALNEAWTQASGQSERMTLEFEARDFDEAVSVLRRCGTVTVEAESRVVLLQTSRTTREVLRRLHDSDLYPTRHQWERVGLEGVFRAVTAEA